MGFHFKIGAITDVGRVRAVNEDHFSVEQELGLFMVADGLGGQNAGEVASKMAIDIMRGHVNNNKGPLMGEYEEEFSPETNRVLSEIRLANSAIYDAGHRNSEQRGMGTTISTVRINGDVMALAHVGDSRIYRIRKGRLERLTVDHSLVEEQLRRGIITEQEAGQSTHKNVITRALGAEETVLIDADEEVLLNRDKILICTDGLTDMVEEGDIERIIGHYGDDPQRVCEELVDIANNKGGIDNITVVLIECEKEAQKSARLERAAWCIIGGLKRVYGRMPGFLKGGKNEKPSSPGGAQGEAVM